MVMVSTVLLEPRPARAARPAPAGLSIELTLRERVATLRLDEFATDDGVSAVALAETLATLEAKAELDAVVLRGRRIFESDGLAEGRAYRGFHAASRAVACCALPTIAVIEGGATGAGLELALACDARVARGGATLSLPGVKVARLPVNGGAHRLPLLVGFAEAARMIIHGETVGARDALRMGLVDALDVEDVDRFAAGWRSPRPRWSRSRLTAAEKIAADATLLGEGQRLKRAFPGQTSPLAALRAMTAGIGVCEREATAEAVRLDEKLSHSEEAGALAHAAEGARALAGAGALEEAWLAQLAIQLRWPLLGEAVHLLDEGASPAQVDRCLTAYGFASGPFAESDRQGLCAVFRSGPTPEDRDWRTYSPTLDLMIDAGRIGGSGNRGWYQPGDGECAVPRSDPAVERLLDNSAVSQRLRRQPLSDDTVTRRCLQATIDATVALTQVAPKLNAGALDAIWIGRLGFPRWKGGPLFQAARLIDR